MTLALVGVFVMQLYYIRESYNLNSKLFEQNINQALTAVVNKVQKQNAADNINKKTIDVALKHKDTELERAQKYVDLRERFKKEEEQRKLANYKQIVDGDVLVLSTFFPKAPWKAELAMARNPIIYGLADEIYVAESSDKGGTWSGVVDGLRKNRKIFPYSQDVIIKKDNK